MIPPLLQANLWCLSRFGYQLPDQITVHIDAGQEMTKTRDLLTDLRCDWVVSTKGESLQARASGGGTLELVAKPRVQETSGLYRA